MSTELAKLDNWLISNRLSLNVLKCSYMIMTHNSINIDPLVTIRNTPLTRVETVKFLGVTLDDKLKFSIHIENVAKKMSRAVGVIFRLSSIIPRHLLTSLYYSLVFSHMIYCITVWGRGNVTDILKLERINRRALSMLDESTYCFNNVTDVYEYFTLLKMYKCIYFNNSQHFRDKLDFLIPLQNHSTRSIDKCSFNIPFYHKSLSHKFFFYQGVKAWNRLPQDLREPDTLHAFKRKIKHTICSE